MGWRSICGLRLGPRPRGRGEATSTTRSSSSARFTTIGRRERPGHLRARAALPCRQNRYAELLGIYEKKRDLAVGSRLKRSRFNYYIAELYVSPRSRTIGRARSSRTNKVLDDRARWTRRPSPRSTGSTAGSSRTGITTPTSFAVGSRSTRTENEPRRPQIPPRDQTLEKHLERSRAGALANYREILLHRSPNNDAARVALEAHARQTRSCKAEAAGILQEIYEEREAIGRSSSQALEILSDGRGRDPGARRSSSGRSRGSASENARVGFRAERSTRRRAALKRRPRAWRRRPRRARAARREGSNAQGQARRDLYGDIAERARATRGLARQYWMRLAAHRRRSLGDVDAAAQRRISGVLAIDPAGTTRRSPRWTQLYRAHGALERT